MTQPTRSWVVLKFGGTSVSNARRWETIAGILRSRTGEGLRPLVVCSALSGVSDLLDQLLDAAEDGRDPGDLLEELHRRHRELARELTGAPPPGIDDLLEEVARRARGVALTGEASPRLRARVLAAGELLSTRLGAAYLNHAGVSTRWRDARELLEARRESNLNPHRRFLAATCPHEPDPELGQALSAHPEPVLLTQGFIARDPDGETVLLGRGGSDTSAACLAARLQADRLEIWTDVPGLFTANPREVPSARLLKKLDYDEAQELASTGARVLHPRCIAPARDQGIPVHLRCTPHPDLPGTVISADAPTAGARVKAISSKAGVRLVSMETLGMWQQVGFLADVFAVFRRHGLSVDLVTTSETNVTVSLDPTANAVRSGTLRSLLDDLRPHCRARGIGPCAAVSVVGHHIRSLLHRLGPALEAFEEQHVYLVSQAASDLNLTFVVDEDQAPRLVRRLHDILFRYRKADEVFGPTWGELFDSGSPVEVEEGAWWVARREELLELAASRSPTYVYDEETLRATADRLSALGAVDRVFYSVKANPHPRILQVVEEAGFGFECVSPGELERVRDLFPDLERDRLLFTPNFAPREEYLRGFELDAMVTVDNAEPLERWAESFAGRDLLLRIDPGEGRGHHRYVHTAGPHSKFGIAPGELDRVARSVAEAGARVVGLHAHVGSGIRDPETWPDLALSLRKLARRFPDVRILDLGGGLGVGERPGDPPLDLAEVDRRLSAFREAHPGFEVWIEPGRFLVAEAGVLLATVTQTKRKGAVRYVGTDTGMNSLLRPALYGSYHHIVNLSRLDAPATLSADVVGPICESGDVLGYGRRLPETRSGDVLLVARTGAYGRVMGSSYNLRPPASEAVLPAR